ncbi:amino acid ABC transporter substrate-binding protein, PAAT family [Marinobacter antarcticus]|uniref:Amino acid ABC transporter substrate-binding protein, PAAT family n=1 Tax=Marinobacter antarcticus TaxID=564117 RepID=A0A1M6Q298_9GAMM|nr:transporter substrate-binding domain-containing protein [Marinobacter antarcticus]SHK14237.1 amino acid ABC transporter substrate-binding protein, PAAT family [Marinobacter antarcticus]
MFAKKDEEKMRTARWSVLFVGWIGICLYPTIAWAETIRFATIDYCPFTCDPSKEAGKEGFMTDVVREAFEQAGYTLVIDMLPYARAVDSVQTGKYDGIIVVGRDYAPNLVYPDEPTVVQRVAFLVNSGTSWKYTGVESLSGVIVGIVKGFHYVDPDLITYLEKEQRNEDRVHVIHGESTTRRGLLMLQANRVSTFLEGEYSAVYQLDKMGIREAVTIAGFTTEAFEDYTGFSPRNPDAARHAEILSDKITDLKKSGRLDGILRRYGIL